MSRRRGRGIALRLQARRLNSSLTNAHRQRAVRFAGERCRSIFTGAPNDGDTVTLSFNLPDGTTRTSPYGDDAIAAGRQPVHHRRHAGGDGRQLQIALTTAIGNLAGSR